MSGLEAVAAFALACNVMQVVEAGYKTVGTCKRIYQTGQPDPALDGYGGQLRDISSALETQLNKTTGPLSPDDTRLRDLAARSAAIANGLLDQIASVSKSAGKRTIGSSICLAIKSRFKQSDLSRWERDLEKAQSTMETQLLVGLRQRVDANMLQNDEMDRELRYFVRQLSEGQTSLSNLVVQQTREIKEEISKGFTEAEASTKTHITTELLRNDTRIQDHVSKAFDDVQVVVERHTQEDSASRVQEEAYRHLLSSLKFPEMEARRNHVSHACPETFRWIFDSQDSSSYDEYDDTEDDWEDTDDDDNGNNDNDEDGDEGDEGDDSDDDNDDDEDEGSHSTGSIDSDISMSPDSSDAPTWDSFPQWLQSSEPVYWISGKPASGKSTLMKFILSHDATKPLLQEWQDNVRILSHFFWRPGTELQQSIKGLLCSLLHQIFVQDKNQALSYLEPRRELSCKDSSSDWDQQELQDLLIASLCPPSAAFCLFIDGLDEVWPKDGVHNLLILFDTLFQRTKHLKLCVSSRRECLLEDRLQKYPQLKMHELIAKDLKEYVTRVLGEALVYGHVDFGSISEMVTEIVSASDGVFLWVVLVSNSLSRGIRNGDSHQELWQRLNSLPRDLEGLYQDMWLRQNEDDEIYQTSSAKLFYLNLLFSRSWVGEPGSLFVPTVFELMAAMDDKVLDYHLIPRHYPVEELRRRCQAAVKMIRVRSAGLLEIFDVPQDDLGYDFPFSFLVGFIHRSAEDFLTDTQQGRAVWADHGMTYDLAFTKLYLARLASISYSVGKPSGDNSWEVRGQLHTLAINRESLKPSTIRHCLQETTKWWHYFSTPAVDQTYPGRHVVLVEAGRLGLFDYVSERLSAEQDESSAVPQLFLHSTCTHGWVRSPYTSTDAVHRNAVDGQCRLLRLFLDKVSFRDPKPFILPPVGDGGPCHSISQTLGYFLRFIRHSLDVNGTVCAEALLDTLEAFKGTPVDLTDKVLLSLDFVTDHFLTPPFEQYVKMSLFRPGATEQSLGTERVQMEISLGNWVDVTRAGLLALIDGNHSVTRDKSCTPRVRFTSLIRWNTANELCMHTLNESDANHLSHMAQELLYSLFTHCFGRLPHRHTLYQNFFDEVTSLREGRVKSVVETVDAVGDRA